MGVSGGVREVSGVVGRFQKEVSNGFTVTDGVEKVIDVRGFNKKKQSIEFY